MYDLGAVHAVITGRTNGGALPTATAIQATGETRTLCSSMIIDAASMFPTFLSWTSSASSRRFSALFHQKGASYTMFPLVLDK